MVMSTGMTHDEVQDQLDLPALRAYTVYWQGFPPVHVMVAAHFGIEPPKRVKAGASSGMDPGVLADLMAAFPETAR